MSMVQTNILIVDDTPANLRLLADILSKAGYLVRPARDGETAVRSAQSAPPDLILLDIVMPHLDGYDVCQQLKADERTADIPIIFISALDNVEDKVKSFTNGGVDYITKPFQSEEVLARVQTHLTIRKLQMDLLEQISELNAFCYTVAHDLKSPLATVVGFSELLATSLASNDFDEQIRNIHIIQTAALKSSNIVDELLLLAKVRKEDVPCTAVNMAKVIAEVYTRLCHIIEENKAEIILPESWPTVQSYAPWLEEVWANYISNALKYGGKPPSIKLGATKQADGTTKFWVQDNGNGLTTEEQNLLFTEFSRLNNNKASGHGLGLSIVQRIVTKLGGTVGVKSEVGQGSTFYFTLPFAD